MKTARPHWGDPGSRVKRVTNATVFSSGARRKVVVTVYPDGTIGLRLLRSRREEYVSADHIYRQAVIERVAFERAQKRRKK